MICGEPRVAAECRCTEREFGWCARPTVRPGRTVHDDRDHGDGSDTRPRGRRTNGSLTETSVRDWPYWRERFDGSADRHMNPGPLDGTDPGPGTSSPRASSQTDRSTPMAIRPWSSTMRATRSSCQVARLHGRGTRQPGRECDGRDSAGARGRGSWPPAPMIPTWPGGSTVSRPSLGSSHRVREKLAARRPRVVVEEPAQSRRRVPVFGRVGPPRRHVCHDRGPGRTLCVSRGAQAGGVRATAAPGRAPVPEGRAPLRGAASYEAER